MIEISGRRREVRRYKKILNVKFTRVSTMAENRYVPNILSVRKVVRAVYKVFPGMPVLIDNVFVRIKISTRRSSTICILEISASAVSLYVLCGPKKLKNAVYRTEKAASSIICLLKERKSGRHKKKHLLFT